MKKLVKESLNVKVDANEIIPFLESYAAILMSGETRDFNNEYDYEEGEKVLAIIKKIQSQTNPWDSAPNFTKMRWDDNK